MKCTSKSHRDLMKCRLLRLPFENFAELSMCSLEGTSLILACFIGFQELGRRSKMLVVPSGASSQFLLTPFTVFLIMSIMTSTDTAWNRTSFSGETHFNLNPNIWGTGSWMHIRVAMCVCSACVDWLITEDHKSALQNNHETRGVNTTAAGDAGGFAHVPLRLRRRSCLRLPGRNRCNKGVPRNASVLMDQ